MNSRKLVATLAISGSALVTLALSEGFRDKTYDDGVGVNTIGFGTTEGVKPGDRITVERALIRLLDDTKKKEVELKRCIGNVPMHQHEWDAIVSWTYNVGTGAACKSTLVRKLKAGDYSGACAELLRWTKAGGKELPGLVKRRQAEYKQCMGGV